MTPNLHLHIPIGIGPIIEALHDIREQSLAQRQRENQAPKLPSRSELKEIIEGLATVLFPNRLGTGDLTDESIDYYVGQLLDAKLRQLRLQMLRELRYAAEQSGERHPDARSMERQALDVARDFAQSLPRIRELLDSDLAAAFEGDPAAHSVDEVLVCYPGISAMIHHRLAHKLYRLGLPLIARMIGEIAHSETGIDIHPGARIGSSFFIDHGTGVVIGETCIIGERVRLYQAVTLGAKRFPADEHGVLIKGGARHPIIQDDVVIYAGATILGRITIGRGSTIGGNVWVTHSVPENSHLTQAPARSELFIHGAGI
jgi:serine O-acetyltransferase